MDILTLRLTERVIENPHFSAEEKGRIKRLVGECSQKEEELMLLRDYLGNMCMQLKPGVSEDNAKWLRGEMERVHYQTGRISSDIMNMYVCGMGPIFEKLVKIQN
ncbi:hypothetical protein HYT26_00365 [Candidatus Pacearchaeota archaeon]|nr:hypothetical protein [Candidatus Pacearchaeota archaeon]